jgi:hypothetical protein
MYGDLMKNVSNFKKRHILAFWLGMIEKRKDNR